MTLRRVDSDGLKKATPVHCTRVCICCFIGIMTFSYCAGYYCLFWSVEVSWSGIRISHNPKLLLQSPFRVNPKKINICRCCLSNKMKQPSSINCLSDNEDWFVSQDRIHQDLCAEVVTVVIWRIPNLLDGCIVEFRSSTWIGAD